MNDQPNSKPPKTVKRGKIKPSCDICEFYDWDGDSGDKICTVALDEDDLAGYISGSDCPYFRYYDEYKSVQKQN
ncbi:MAG: DUF6472 family protein [Eubacteriales bacterium]